MEIRRASFTLSVAPVPFPLLGPTLLHGRVSYARRAGKREKDRPEGTTKRQNERSWMPRGKTERRRDGEGETEGGRGEKGEREIVPSFG